MFGWFRPYVLILAVLVLLVLVIFYRGHMLMAVGVPPGDASLAIAYQEQLADNWCWAASTVMIAAFHSRNTTQCDVANLGLMRADCCPAVPHGSCNVAGWPPFDGLAFH